MQCKDLDGFKLKNGDDPPDIVAIKDNHYSIGIEITEVYSDDKGLGSKSRERAAICEKICRKCDELNKKLNPDYNYYVNLYFSYRELKNDIETTERISEQLVNLINNPKMIIGERRKIRSEDVWKKCSKNKAFWDEIWPKEIF